jgi:hypothetical protein
MRFLFVLINGLLIGCAARPHQNEKGSGISREEVRAYLADSWLLVSASRPITGWRALYRAPAGGRAKDFEHFHPGITVHMCDVYWVGHSNAPPLDAGIWLDYFYFDRHERLIESERIIIE